MLTSKYDNNGLTEDDHNDRHRTMLLLKKQSDEAAAEAHTHLTPVERERREAELDAAKVPDSELPGLFGKDSVAKAANALALQRPLVYKALRLRAVKLGLLA
jgi:hypothetical protein